MKKYIISSLLVLLCSVTMYAQNETTELVNKKGLAILPKAGDISMGIEASPYLDYFGNLFSGHDAQNTIAPPTVPTFHFRYYLQDNAAIRMKLLINNSTSNNKSYVQDDAARTIDPLSNATVEDLQTIKNHQVDIHLAYQIFRGKGRLRGFYGPQVAYKYANTKTSYKYGNAFTEENTAPTSQFGSTSKRPTLDISSNKNILELGGIAGVEYFIMPKVSIGAEINLTYSYTMKGQSYSESEYWNGTGVSTEETAVSPSTHNTKLTTSTADFYSGIYFMFAF